MAWWIKDDYDTFIDSQKKVFSEKSKEILNLKKEVENKENELKQYEHHY